MTLADVHFSSATDLWSTPQEFFELLRQDFPLRGRRLRAAGQRQVREILHAGG